MRTVERCKGVGVSMRYRSLFASKVNLRTWFCFGSISVVFVSNGEIGMETSCLLKLSAFSASCGEVGVLLKLINPVRLLVILVIFTPPVLSSADSNRSSNFNSSGVVERFRIVSAGNAMIVQVWRDDLFA